MEGVLYSYMEEELYTYVDERMMADACLFNIVYTDMQTYQILNWRAHQRWAHVAACISIAKDRLDRWDRLRAFAEQYYY